MAQPIASVQLIIFGQRTSTDFEGVLQDVSSAGYSAIEAGNLFEQFGENVIDSMLGKNDLSVSGAHFGYGDYAKPEKLKSHILYAQAVELKHLMCSGVADSKTVEGYKQSARLFNDVGRILANEGLSFNYHNHAWEFEDLGGVNGMEILSQETDPALVKFNIDVFWVWYGGKDPAEFIRKHRDRAGYFHFKDGKRGVGDNGKTRPIFTELGQGDVDLKAAFESVREVGASYIVTEQDSTERTALESITMSRTYLRDVLSV